MNIKRLAVGIIIIFLFIISSIAGYFTIKYSNSFSHGKLGQNVDNKNNKIAQPASVNIIQLINSNTKITKRDRYTKGAGIVVETVERPGPALIGQSREGTQQYFSNQNYLLTEFSSSGVVVIKDIPTWPPNYYVVKSDNNVINIYIADNKGDKLTLVQKADLDLDNLQTEERSEIEKGKIFKSLKDIEDMIEELTT